MYVYLCVCVCSSLLIVNMHTNLCALVRVFMLAFPCTPWKSKVRVAVHVCIYVSVCVCVMRELRVYTHKKDIASLMPVKKLRPVIMQISFRVWDRTAQSQNPAPGQCVQTQLSYCIEEEISQK